MLTAGRVVADTPTDFLGSETLYISIRGGYTDFGEYTLTAVYHTTISIGVAYCGDELVRNYDERIIERADKAAYAAKHAGRNRVCAR